LKKHFRNPRNKIWERFREKWENRGSGLGHYGEKRRLLNFILNPND
jgi:hypothetical protein